MSNYESLERAYESIVEKFGVTDFSYCDPKVKTSWHKAATRMMRLLADTLSIPSKDVRSNKGGIAVSGEVTLRSDRIYVQMSQWTGSGLKLLIRSCNGRQDCKGGPNNVRVMQPGGAYGLLQTCRFILDKEVAR